MQIAVVGCGWLGLPLALSLQKSGHNIVATRRSEAGCKQLTSHGCNSVHFELGHTYSQQQLAPILDANLLILNIPFSRKTSNNTEFSNNIQTLLQQAKNSQIANIIFISTTSVYGSQQSELTENSLTAPNTLSGQANLEVEQLTQQYFGLQATVIRLAGLVGGTRHPINFLAGKTELSAANQVVNLVHQADVIQSIESVINNNLWGHTFVLSAYEHPTRQAYYTWAANQLGLVVPEFLEEQSESSGKTINATESLKKLGVKLKYPSPYDMF